MSESPSTSRNASPSRLLPAVGDPVSSLWQRLAGGTRLIRRPPDWDRFAGEGWADRIMAEPVTDRLHEKQGRSIGRRLFTDGRAAERLPEAALPAAAGGTGCWRRCSRMRGVVAGACRSGNASVWATDKGFPVPRPVAAGQFVGPWFRLQGFLAVEELHGMLPLHEAVPLAAARLDPRRVRGWKRGLVAELARLARELHRRKVFHKDLYFCHFYIPESFTRRPRRAGRTTCVMIDLHRLAAAHVIARVVAGEGPRAAPVTRRTWRA